MQSSRCWPFRVLPELCSPPKAYSLTSTVSNRSRAERNVDLIRGHPGDGRSRGRRRFKSDSPALFGVLLDLLSETLPNREVAQLPDGVDERMMDFALFGEAVRLTLGKEPGTFTKLYAANRAPHSKDIAECDLIWGTR